MNCEQCQVSAPWLTQVDSKWVGPCCVPAERWAMYPLWRDRESLRQRRSDLARQNFRKEPVCDPQPTIAMSSVSL